MTKVVKSREDLKNLQRHRRTNNTVAVVAVVSVGCIAYSYKVGRKRGFTEGVNVGYVTAGQEMMSAWRAHAEEMRLSREAK